MASKKDLKKNVNYIIGELFTECWIQYNHASGTDKEKAKDLMAKMLTIQNDFVNRISHPEPGQIKGFYKKFRSDFNAQVNSLIEELGKLNQI